MVLGKTVYRIKNSRDQDGTKKNPQPRICSHHTSDQGIKENASSESKKGEQASIRKGRKGNVKQSYGHGQENPEINPHLSQPENPFCLEKRKGD